MTYKMEGPQKRRYALVPKSTFCEKRRKRTKKDPLQSTRASLRSKSVPALQIFPHNRKSLTHRRNITIPKEFDFMTSRRARHNENKENEFQFAAKTMPDFSRPFTTHPSSKSLTYPLNVILHTEQRSENRQAFDQHVKEVKEKEEEEKKKLKIEQEIQEQIEIKQIRKQMEFKAKPIYHPLMGLPVIEQKPLTIPKSPKLLTEQRSHISNK